MSGNQIRLECDSTTSFAGAQILRQCRWYERQLGMVHFAS